MTSPHLNWEPDGILPWNMSSAAWDTTGSEFRLHTASTLSSLEIEGRSHYTTQWEREGGRWLT